MGRTSRSGSVHQCREAGREAREDHVVVDRDDRFPTFDAGFLEDQPESAEAEEGMISAIEHRAEESLTRKTLPQSIGATSAARTEANAGVRCMGSF
jgi:hypothetical protein